MCLGVRIENNFFFFFFARKCTMWILYFINNIQYICLLLLLYYYDSLIGTTQHHINLNFKFLLTWFYSKKHIRISWFYFNHITTVLFTKYKLYKKNKINRLDSKLDGYVLLLLWCDWNKINQYEYVSFNKIMYAKIINFVIYSTHCSCSMHIKLY